MARSAWGLGLVLLLAAAAETRSAEGVDGNWKITLLAEDKPTLWLLKLTTKDGKVGGELLAKAAGFPETSLDELVLKDDVLHMILKIKSPQGEQKVVFDCKVNPKEPKKILGTAQIGRRTFLASLDQTPLTALDPFDLFKEKVSAATAPELFDSTLELLSAAGEKKVKADEVRAFAAKAAKAAEAYGPVWQREYALRIAEVLSAKGGDELSKEALPYARQAERLLVPGEAAAVQKRVLTVLAAALTKAGKEEEAKEVETRLSKLDASVVPVKFAGRKGASERVVLVELFTGAECPPCVAADMGFDGLLKTYKPKEVVLLQYHLHIPGPDPLTNPDGEKRQRYYGEDIEGTPAIFFNGKVEAPGGGSADDAQTKYDEYVGVIGKLLETDGKAKLTLSAARKGDKIDITAEAADVATPGEKLRLRLVLVEEVVAYKGGNRVPQHHHVVRSFPGGTAGLPLTEKTGGKQTATVNVEELRKKLKEYLTDYDKDSPFPNKDRPLDLKKLSVVAFVQNDATHEVIQAVQAEVATEKE
jgi:hypothetical protein